MDRLRVEGLALSASIGVRRWERHVRQRIVVDLEWDTDAARAARRDELGDADDYSRVVRCVTELVDARRFNLIESLAQAIAEAILATSTIRRVAVTVHKPSAIPSARDTSVAIERSR
jgi:7,8-dihydroneopterin aldolase/epimerase/oxygenase